MKYSVSMNENEFLIQPVGAEIKDEYIVLCHASTWAIANAVTSGLLAIQTGELNATVDHIANFHKYVRTIE